MRPVNKGDAPKTFKTYDEARHPLAKKIGYYCSYCEMPVFQSIEVEHILPINQGGAAVDWNNFLLSCKYCNTIKSDHNYSLQDFYWPDRDNTDLAFEYGEAFAVRPHSGLDAKKKQIAQNTIDLEGLNRFSGGINEPTEADTRWRSRQLVWDLAKRSFQNWNDAPISAMASQIGISAIGKGHYSIWMTVFQNVPEVQAAIDLEYKKVGLYKDFNPDGSRKTRTGGTI